MKKKILALILVLIVMTSTTLTFAHKDDIPKIFSIRSIRPPIHIMNNNSFR